MKFITFSELNADIVANLHKIPSDIDIIVGIPRSGLLVATIIALYMNKMVTDIDSFCRKEISSVGRTKNQERITKNFDDIKKVLVVEDSVNTGKSLFQVKERISNLYSSDISIEYLAVYIRIDSKESVDYYFRILDDIRVFEWNFLHIITLKDACFDIDGVLCVDPSREENDDGEKYKDFLFTMLKIKKKRYTRKVYFKAEFRLPFRTFHNEDSKENRLFHFAKKIYVISVSAE